MCNFVDRKLIHNEVCLSFIARVYKFSMKL